jgi:hypothetical protein
MKWLELGFFDSLNARHEPLPEAGAQRTLEAAGSMP